MSPLLALEKVSKRFGAVIVADGVDLALGDGEALGIIGPNGAGKTTLFGIATGTVRPDGGRVLFDGEDITALPPERRCRDSTLRRRRVDGRDNPRIIVRGHDGGFRVKPKHPINS